MISRGRAGWGKFWILACFICMAAGLQGCDSPSGKFGEADDDDEVAVSDAAEPPAKVHPGTAGEVLIIGGGASTLTSSHAAELFNPVTGTFVPTGKMTTTRAGIQAVDFATGPLAQSVLVVGGLHGSATLGAHGALNFKASFPTTSEIFTDGAGAFKPVAATTVGSFFYSMTLLQSGSVLIVGGYDGATPAAAASYSSISKAGYLFDPATQTIKPTAPLNSARALHTATLLPDGTVLIVGGITDVFGDTVGTAELYNPVTNAFTNLPQALPGNLTLAGHTATLISGCSCADDGKVLISDGFSGVALGSQALESSVQNLTLYDPTSQTFTSVGSTVDDRMLHTASLLSDGKVLLAGGIQGQGFVGGGDIRGIFGGVRASAEIFDPKLNTTTCVGGLVKKECADSMTHSRAGHSATVLANGDVLMAGGVGAKGSTSGGKGSPEASAELFSATTKTFKAVGKMLSAHAFHAAVLLQ